MWKKVPDSFLLGIFSGLISLSLFYIVLAYIRTFLVNQYQNPYLLVAPKVHLFAIFLNVLVFRFLIVKADKENLAKGILLSTVVTALIYFFYFFKYHQSLIG
jgi:hypothetical protein